MNIELLQSLLNKKEIEILLDVKTADNNKASEAYLHVKFIQDDGFTWTTFVPFIDRRANLFIESEKECAEHLKYLRPFFTERKMKEWRRKEWTKWKKSKGDVTKEFFKVLLSFKEEFDFPANDNPARRIQDIKDKGYVIASLHHRRGRKTSRTLLPVPKFQKRGYESFSNQFKSRVIRLLGGINAFEAKPTNKGSLIPDHKFSEVRWDENTRGENPMTMSDEDIKSKFQLLDNQRNQQKREVCRICYQTGQRGKIYGIDYYYQGSGQWDESIPAQGKVAEEGCIGCPWYDIEEWRRQLNDFLNGSN